MRLFAKSPKRKDRPNVIMLLMDQMRNDFIQNYSIFEEIKKTGVLFSEMITYAPYTAGALHAIFSGIYGMKNGMNAYYNSLKFKKNRCYTLAQYLQDYGYFTQADIVSKILLPPQGFEKISTFDENKVNLTERHKKILRNINTKKTPFFLFLNYSFIHRQIVKNVVEKYGYFDENYFGHRQDNIKRYGEYAKESSRYLEGMFNFIKDSDLLRDSLIIIFSDHGVSLGEKPGEKAYGIYTYDYTIKTWAFFLFPQMFPGNIEIKELTRNIDILPTVLKLLNIKPSQKHMPIQGCSLLPLIQGLEVEPRIAYCETGGLDGPNPSPYEPNVKCVRTNEWKLIYNSTTKQKELYNIKSDPREEKNVLSRYPEVEKKLFEIMQEYIRSNSRITEEEIIKMEYRKLGYLPNG